MTDHPRHSLDDDLPEEFVESLKSYTTGTISIEQVRRKVGALLQDNQDWGPCMLAAIDHAYQSGRLNGTAYRTLLTEVDVATAEDEPTEWSEETCANATGEFEPLASSTKDIPADDLPGDEAFDNDMGEDDTGEFAVPPLLDTPADDFGAEHAADEDTGEFALPPLLDLPADDPVDEHAADEDTGEFALPPLLDLPADDPVDEHAADEDTGEFALPPLLDSPAEDSIDEHTADEDAGKLATPPTLTAEVGSSAAQSEIPLSNPPQEAQTVSGPGTLLGERYLIEEQISAGSMSEVFRAIDQDAKSDGEKEVHVAIKLLAPEFARSPHGFDALRQEAAHAGRLAHPNIVRVLDFVEDGDRCFLTMEWLNGRSLAHMLQRQRFQPLSQDQVKPIIEGLCRGLAHAHDQGIVHADIKPGNVFVAEDNQPKLLDFGISRAAAGTPDDFDASDIEARTPAYASCEVLEGAHPEPTDDIYSLGCVIYRMLAGRRAFSGANALDAESRDLSLKRIPNLSDSQWQALRGALALRRAHRTQDVATFIDEFSGVVTGSDAVAPAIAADDGAATKGFQGLPLKYGVPALAATLTAIALFLFWPTTPQVTGVATLPPVTEKAPEPLPAAKPPPATQSESISTRQEAATEPVNEVPETTADASITDETTSDEPTTDASITDAPIVGVPIIATQIVTKPQVEVASTAPTAATSPITTQVTAPPDTERVDELLTSANQRMDDGQLIEPTADSARYFVNELDAIEPDSTKTQQTRMRLANLMLFEAMVAINDDNFSVAENWITQTRELDVPEALIARYETELADARAAKSARDTESLGAIFASATPAAILANPDFNFDTEPTATGVGATTTSASQPTALAMVLPGGYAPTAGGEADLPTTEVEAAPQLTPLSELKFRRFVRPERPPRSVTRGATGWVEVQFSVNKKGRTENIQVVNSEPAEMFDRAALDAIRKWRFRPYIVEGKTTPTETGVRLKFEGG